MSPAEKVELQKAAQAFRSTDVKNRSELIRLAKHFGINKNIFLHNVPPTAEEFAQLVTSGGFADWSASSDARTIQDCLIVGRTVAVMAAMEHNYYKQVERQQLETLLRPRLERFEKRGTSTADAIRAWNGDEGFGQFYKVGGDKGYYIIVEGYWTDDHEVAKEVVETLNGAGVHCASVMVWSADGPVPLHIISAITIDNGSMQAMDYGEDEGKMTSIKDGENQLTIYHPIAKNQHNKPLQALNKRYMEAIEEIKMKCLMVTKDAKVAEVLAQVAAAPAAPSWAEVFVKEHTLDPTGSSGVLSLLESQCFDGLEDLFELNDEELKEILPQMGPRKKVKKM